MVNSSSGCTGVFVTYPNNLPLTGITGITLRYTGHTHMGLSTVYQGYTACLGPPPCPQYWDKDSELCHKCQRRLIKLSGGFCSKYDRENIDVKI